MTLRAGVIAAGLGSRFAARGVATPKAMIRIAGKPLIYWVASQLTDAGFSSLVAIFNETNADSCAGGIHRAFPTVALDVIRKDTGSSFESFIEVLAHGGTDGMLVTTVDAVMAPGTVRRFVETLGTLPRDALVLGVSSHVDDEKPLYVEVGENRRITALGQGPCDHVTCGVYRLPAGTARAGAGGTYGALREFLGALIGRGMPAYAIDCGKTIDVDRPQDLAAAERMLEGRTPGRPGAQR